VTIEGRGKRYVERKRNTEEGCTEDSNRNKTKDKKRGRN
jgi:hypothetical protein